MFDEFLQTFYPSHKTFANKTVLSANKFVTLQPNHALYVRVQTFAKQSINGQIPIISTPTYTANCIELL